MKRFFFLFLLLSGISVQAVNDDLKSLVNNLLDGGSFCGLINKDEAERLLNQCELRRSDLESIKNTTHGGLQLFNEVIYREAFDLQNSKDQCFIDQLDSVLPPEARANETKEQKADRLKKDENRETYVFQATSVWLRYKKASLILDQCQKINAQNRESGLEPWNRPARSEADEYDLQEMRKQQRLQYLTKVAKIPRDWVEYCSDTQALQNLNLLKERSSFALPIQSDKKVLDIMESERHYLISTKTGKPVTDQEIVASDVENMDLELQGSPSRDQKLNKFLNNARSQRQEIQKAMGDNSKSRTLWNRLQDTREFRESSFSDEIRDHLYEDGTVDEVLLKYGFKGQDSDLQKKMVRCFMYRHERSMTSDVLTLLASYFIFRMNYGKESLTVLKSSRLIPGAKVSVPALMANLDQIWPDVAKSCRHLVSKSDLSSKRKIKTLASSETSVQKKLLPKGLGFEIYTLDAGIPSCEKVQNKRGTENTEILRHCVYDAMTNAAPFKTSLSLAALREPLLKLQDR